MFKKFVERIVACENQLEALDKVFYGEDGIDRAFQMEKISWKEHQLLLALIGKLA